MLCVLLDSVTHFLCMTASFISQVLLVLFNSTLSLERNEWEAVGINLIETISETY